MLLGEGLIAGFLVGMAFVACDRILAIVIMVCAFTVYGMSVASQPVNHLDIAPAYAGDIAVHVFLRIFTCFLISVTTNLSVQRQKGLTISHFA